MYLVLFLLFQISLIYFQVEALGKTPQKEGIIKGKVINRTRGSVLPPDLDIILNGITEKEQPVRLSLKLDKSGQFIFRNLKVDPKIFYFVSVNYKGAEYLSPILNFKEQELNKEITLDIFESETTSDKITIKTDHFIIEYIENKIMITEVISIINRSDRTFVGKPDSPDVRPATFIIPLPDAFGDLNILEGTSEQSVLVKDKKLIDSIPLRPGLNQRIISYSITPSSSSYSLMKELFYDTDRAEILLSSNGLKISGDELESREPLQMKDKKYLHYSLKNLKKGNKLKIEISGFPKYRHPFLLLIAISLSSIIMLVLGFLIYKKKYKSEKIEKRAESENLIDINKSQRENLISEIADLDERYEQGEIQEPEYSFKRNQLKQELINISRRINIAE